MDRPDMEEASSDLETTCDFISVGNLIVDDERSSMRGFETCQRHELHVQSSSAPIKERGRVIAAKAGTTKRH